MKATKASKEKIRDWTHNRDMWIRVLEEKTGKSLAHWNARIKKEKFADAHSLKTWLALQEVTGLAQESL